MANNTVTVGFSLLLLVWKCFSVNQLSGDPAFAVVGDNITLTLACTADDDKNYIKWRERTDKDFLTIAEIKPKCAIDLIDNIQRNGYVYTCNITAKQYFLSIPIHYVNESLLYFQWICNSFIGKGSDSWKLNISVPVKTLTITPTGAINVTYIVKGEAQNFTCITDLCRPAASIQWYINGRNMTNEAHQQITQDNQLFRSSSRLLYTGNISDHNTMIYCETFNIAGRENVKSTAKIIFVQVLVTNVTILPAGDNNVITVVVGEKHRFTCITDFSRPVARIHWYIGEKNVTQKSHLRIIEGEKSSSMLNYEGNNVNHKQNIHCEAVNIEGRNTVNSTELMIRIQLPVTAVVIAPTGDNNVIYIEQGMTQNFTCTTHSNRPAAWITWYIGGHNMTNQALQNKEQENADKFSTSSILMYKGKYADHNQTVYCEAINIVGSYNVTSQYKYINIQFGPKNISVYPTTNFYMVTEIKSVDKIMCSATCRPNCHYTWIGPSSYRNEKSYLRFDAIYRNQSGLYFCEARNSFGSMESNNITIAVNYPPTILRLHTLNNNTANEYESVTIKCVVDSHPASDITWNFTRTSTILNTSTTVLQSSYSIPEAKCQHTGTYQCQATNVIDEKSMVETKCIDLYVRCSSRRDDRKPNEEDVIGLSNSDILNITAYLIAYPQPLIYWTFAEEATGQNKSVSFNNSYGVFEHRSNLQKLQIDEHDFGVYTVHATNNIGKEYIRHFTVSAQRTPNPPTNVSVTCGIFSITVHWRSEYNGGETQIFKVHFLDAKTNTSIHSEVVLDEGENKDRYFKTDSMNPSTLYVIRVNTLNNYGSATTENVNCTTETDQEENQRVTSVLVGGIAGSISALLIVVFVIGCSHFQRRRQHPVRNKELIKRESNDTDEEEDGLKDNPLYVTSGEVSNAEGGPVYGVVNKIKQKKENADSDDKKNQGPVHAEEQKSSPHGKKSQKRKKTKDTLKKDNNTAIELDGLKDNPLYVTSGEISNAEEGPMYGVVNKPKQNKENVDSDDKKNQGPVHAEVQKSSIHGKKKQKKQKNKKTKDASKKEYNTDIELGTIYENSDKPFKQTDSEELYANAGEQDDSIKLPVPYTPKKNKDGLVYADVDLLPGPSGNRFVIRGQENRTNYAILDLSKKAEPLPSDNEDEDKDSTNVN